MFLVWSAQLISDGTWNTEIQFCWVNEVWCVAFHQWIMTPLDQSASYCRLQWVCVIHALPFSPAAHVQGARSLLEPVCPCDSGVKNHPQRKGRFWLFHVKAPRGSLMPCSARILQHTFSLGGLSNNTGNRMSCSRLSYSRLSCSRLSYSRLSYSRLSYNRLSCSRLNYSRLSYRRLSCCTLNAHLKMNCKYHWRIFPF